ncbi:Transmembrane protein 173 [Popillia japonica]|uniref:Transmembrane protein 173 n=1 Tax=Popillia japonica TaxID=7064 RepID=A0AAW1KHD5_POPJA
MNRVQSTIPQKRGRAAEVATLILSILLFIIGIWLCSVENKFYAFGVAVTVFPLIIMAAEFMMRVCLIFEEQFHLKSRYNNIIYLFIHALTFSWSFVVVLVFLLFSLFYICLTYGSPFKLLHELGPWSSCCLVGALLFTSLLKPKSGPLYQAISIGNLNGLDYGSAMAYSFFHGYLQIVLPHKGTDQKGIQEIIRDFEAQQGVVFSSHKLFVLIPLSLHCPATIEQTSSIVELAQNLPEITVSRAGVCKRSYKSTVYKIRRSQTEKEYVCLEYATPLQTLFDIIKHRTEHANDYELHKRELVLQFYLTLRTLLNNDPDCKDHCELIFFDDKTDNGQDVDVGEVVLEHLNSYKSKNCRKRSKLQINEKRLLIENVASNFVLHSTFVEDSLNSVIRVGFSASLLNIITKQYV